jgi:hypothetical protein
MGKIAAVEPQREWQSNDARARAPEGDAQDSRLFARVRLMMIISGLTSLIAIAAVAGVIGYRVFRAGVGASPGFEAIVTVPQGARVVSTAVAGDRLVVTLDLAGATEVRTFDAKTLKETGRMRFVAAP